MSISHLILIIMKSLNLYHLKICINPHGNILKILSNINALLKIVLHKHIIYA